MSTIKVEINLDVGVTVPGDYELLTYKEITERLGIKMASARQTVSRKGWRRIKQNDGKVKIEVPLSYLHRDVIKDDDKVDSNLDVKVDVDATVEIAKLSVENDYLKRRISDLESDRDAWKSIAQKSWWRRLIG